MYIPDGTPFQMPQESAAFDFQKESPTWTGLTGNNIASDFTNKAGSFVAENVDTAIDATSNALGFNLPKSQKISAEQINSSAPIGNDGKQVHITDEPMYENVANMITKDKQRELVNEDMNARYSNTHGLLPTLASGAAATLADPASIAAMAYGGAILSSSKVLAGLGALGVDTATTAARVGARVISGAVGGAASMVPLAGAQLGISAYQGGDYDVKSALSDMAFGAVGGALIHGGFGSALHESGVLKPDELMRAQTLKTDFQSQAADILRQPAPVKAAAMNSTIADVVNGRPADPSAVIGKDGQPPNLSQIADDRKQQNQNGYSPNMTPEEMAAARKTILPNGLKVEPQPSRLPDDEINRYKGTVKQELSNAGIENVDDSVVQEIARIKAEQINPEGVAKPRPLAKVEAGERNPESVWKSVDLTPKPVEVAPRPVPVAEPRLPSELSKSSPRWADGKEVAFNSDIDKALYIVGGKGKSPAHDKFVSFLTDKAGLTKQQIAQGALDVREAIKQNAKAKTEVINVPKVFNSEKPLEITVPQKRTVSPFKNPNVIQLAAEMGGLKPHGDLKAMGAETEFVPGRGRLIRDTGRSLHELGLELAGREYTGFDAHNPPSDNQVLELIRRGLNKDHVYSERNRSSMEARDEKTVLSEYHEDLERHAGEMGIDTTGMKPEEIHAELEKQLREAAEEHNALDLLDKEDPSLQRDYYPDMEDIHANETVPTSAHTADEPEISAGDERSEFEAGNEGGIQGSEQVNSELAGRGAEGARADAGRTGTDDGPTASGASGEVVTKGDLYKLPRESLEQMRDETHLSDHEKLIKALGSDEEAKRFNRLVRQSESMDHARADKASKELGEIEDKLTPEQQKLIYGIGETGATKEDLDELIKAHSDITFTPHDDIKDIGYIGTLGIRKMLPEEILSVKEGKASIAAQAALIRFKGALDELRDRGLTIEESFKAMAQGMSEKSGMSIGDATDFVRDFSNAVKERSEEKPTTFEPAKNVAGGGEQGVLSGMEKSAKQAMQARGDKIKPNVEQKPADEGLFKSAIGGGDELDLRIADAERTINASGMTVEERADIQQAYKEAADADKVYSDKMKELGQCLGENGVG
jgi:hypothetical protein